MKNARLLLWILVFFLATNTVFALETVLHNDTFTRADNVTMGLEDFGGVTWSETEAAGNTCLIDDNFLEVHDTNNNADVSCVLNIADISGTTSNLTVTWNFRYSGSSLQQETTFGLYHSNAPTGDPTDGLLIAGVFDNQGTSTLRFRCEGSDGTNESDVGGFSGGVWYSLRVEWDMTTNASNSGRIYQNGTLRSSCNAFNTTVRSFAIDTHRVPNSITIDLNDFLMVNVTNVIPTINESSYNVTSGYANQTVWRTSTTSSVITQDDTPTVTFTMDVSGNCSIGLSDENYTTMIAGNGATQCGTTDVSSHTCTLPSNESLPWVTDDDVYIGCQSIDGENSSSSSGALRINRIPFITARFLAESFTNDFTLNGTNLGETSEAWAAGDNKTTSNIPSLNSSIDNYLLVRNSFLNATLEVEFNQLNIGTIIADTTSDDGYKVYAFRINAGNVSASNNVTFAASSTNDNTTYIDWFALTPAQTVIGDNVVGNGTVVAYFMNITNTSRTDSLQGLVYNQSGSLLNTSTIMLNQNTIADDGYGNTLLAWRTPTVDQNYTFQIRSNFTNYATYIYGTNLTTIIDSTDPLINSVTISADVLVGNNYTIIVNSTDTNVNFVQVSVNDSSFTALNLTQSGDEWTGILNFTLPWGKLLTVLAVDGGNHTANSTFVVSRGSNMTETITSLQHNLTWDYNSIYFNVSDSSSIHNLTFRLVWDVRGRGNAYINDKNVTHTINDTNTFDIGVTLNNTNVTSFGDGNTSLEWTSDDWNNTANNDINFTNTLRYTLADMLQLEWDDSITDNDERWYRFNISDKNTSLTNISLHLPLRVEYSNSTSSIDVFECTSSPDFGAQTCSSWAERTSMVYAQNDLTYHWTNSTSNYPTVDVDEDGLKDTLFFKLPSILPNNQAVYRIVLDGGNGEDAWTTESVVVQPQAGGGAEIPHLGGTEICDIVVSPPEAFLDDDHPIVELKLFNNEDISYSPEVRIRKVTEPSIVKRISLTNPIGTVLQQESQVFGVQYVGSIIGAVRVNGTAELVLVHDRCVDIIVPVHMNITATNFILDLLGGEGPLYKKLHALGTTPITSKAPGAILYYLFGILFVLSGVSIYWLAKKWADSNILNLGAKTVAVLFISVTGTIIITISTRALTG